MFSLRIKSTKLIKLIALPLSVILLSALLFGCAPQTSALADGPQSPEERWGIDKLIIVLMPGEDTPEVAYTRNMFDDALSEALMGLPVEEYHATNYSAMIEAMRTGHAHVGSFGPFAYVHAAERSGAECFAVTSVDGTHGYTSLIVTHVDTGIHTMDDLKGRTFGFVDPESTSGNIVPSNEILNHFADVMPDLTFDDLHINGRFFESVMFTSTHANSMQGVYKMDVDAVAVTNGTLESQINNGQVEEDKIRIIHESPRIPNSPLAIQKDLPQDLKDLVINFFLEWDDEEFWGVRGTTAGTLYWPVEDHEYDYIRELRDKFDLGE